MKGQRKQKGGYSRVMNAISVDGDEPCINNDETIIDIETEYGPMRVTIEGDIKKKSHVFLTYHDIGMNHNTCFRRFFNAARRTDDVFKKFAVVHIDAPGQHEGADEISNNVSHFDMEVLASQINQVVEKLKIESFFGIGVGAGAYILGLYATRNPSKAKALILIGSMAKKCGWIEWRQKWYGLMMGHFSDRCWKEIFLYRWFSQETMNYNKDLKDFYSLALNRIQQKNLMKFLHGYQMRKDYENDLKKIKCQVLLATGKMSWQEQETVEVMCHMDRRNVEYTKFNTGLTVVIEDPNAMVQPIQLLLRGMGIF